MTITLYVNFFSKILIKPKKFLFKSVKEQFKKNFLVILVIKLLYLIRVNAHNFVRFIELYFSS